MKKVLIITYYWPPASGPGVQRYLKFAKYLPEFGWKPYIITVKNGSYSATDETLLDDVPEDTEVVKTKTVEPFAIYNMLTGQDKKTVTVGMMNMNPKKNLIKKMSLFARANLFIPDARKGWNKYAYTEARDLIEREKIETVITTGPPHSTHLIGQKLKKNLNIKWIADFRDPWTNIFYNEALPRTENTKKKDKALEDAVLKDADRIIVVSDGLHEEFSDRTNAEVIYNGFDKDDLAYQPWNDKNRKFTIAHVGNFMPGQNIEALFKALKKLSDADKDFAGKTKISFTGNVDNEVIENFHKYEIDQMLEINGYLPHQEATKAMMTADLLLFVIPNTKRNHLIITGKLFEYIASLTPILAIGPVDGNAAKILHNANRSQMIDFKDTKAIEKRIRQAYNQWNEADKQVKHDSSEIDQFSRKGLTEKLANVLENLTNKDDSII